MTHLNFLSSELEKKLRAAAKSDDRNILKAFYAPLKRAIENKVLPRALSEFAVAAALLEQSFESDIEKIKEIAQTWPAVLEDGTLLGVGKYEQLDVRWAYSALDWLEHKTLPSFPDNPPVIPVKDELSLAIMGDWGGGNWHNNTTASTISTHISNLNSDYIIHLGDTYYAGKYSEVHDHVLSYWPQAVEGSFSLNGNHEMYNAAIPYFNAVLQDKTFALQNGCSFFALENNHWVIIGLDTSFFSDRKNLYMDGNLNSRQIDFLEEQAAKGKSTMVFTHHNGLDVTGSVPQTTLWNQVTGALGETLKYWYWGHVHMGAVYKEMSGIKTRVVGHGVLPYGHASLLENAPCVDWFESCLANDPHQPKRVQNGFAFLRLQDDQLIEESLYGEDGKIHWQSASQAASV